MLMALWIEAVVDSEAPRFEAATEVLGFVVAAEASGVDATQVRNVQAGVMSCVQVKLKGKRGKGFSGSFLRFLVFGWIRFVCSNEIWAGSLLLG
jgi:hypothetical protein